MPYALGYGRIIVLGFPAVIVSTTVNAAIRTDGSPRFAMLSMMVGAVLNTILDPIFIFGFHWGVEGAAIATILSQYVGLICNVAYLFRMKTIQLNRAAFSVSFRMIGRIMSLGFASCFNNLTSTIVAMVSNNLLTKYGEMSAYGADIPITVIGIVMKVNEILNSIVLGLAMGSQPIIGFNYGARKYDRVKKTLKVVMAAGVAVSVVAFVLFQAFPDKLILLFGNSTDPKYIEFAMLSFRIYLLLKIILTEIIRDG